MTKHAITLCLALALTACGTSSEPDYFSLAVQPGVSTSDSTAVIEIHTPVIAGYLDRPDFVRQDGDYRLLIDEGDYWAEPLDSLFARVLAGDLQQRMPAAIVVTEDNATPTSPRLIVDTTLQRFNSDGDGHVVLDGTVIIVDKAATALPRGVPLHMSIEAGSSASSIADGLSQLVAQAADQIVQKNGYAG